MFTISFQTAGTNWVKFFEGPITAVSVEISILIYCLAPNLRLRIEIKDRKIDVTAKLFLLVQKRNKTHV